MTTQIEAYPQYGSQEEKDLWLQRFASQHNILSSGGISGGGSGTGEVDVNEDNGRITDSNNNLLGYIHRYLHFRITSSANGELVNLNSYNGDNIFIGTFNSPSQDTPSNTANFTYTSFEWASGRSIYYTNLGGRTVRFSAEDSDPGGGSTVILDNIGVRDLEVGTAVGATGPSGADAIQVQVTIRDTTNIDLTSNPISWPIDTDGQFFRNNQGGNRTLLSTVFIGGIEQSFNQHNDYSYAWTRNGLPFTPSTSGQTLSTRYLQLTATDIEDGGADQFICTVSNIN